MEAVPVTFSLLQSQSSCLVSFECRARDHLMLNHCRQRVQGRRTTCFFFNLHVWVIHIFPFSAQRSSSSWKTDFLVFLVFVWREIRHLTNCSDVGKKRRLKHTTWPQRIKMHAWRKNFEAILWTQLIFILVSTLIFSHSCFTDNPRKVSCEGFPQLNLFAVLMDAYVP